MTNETVFIDAENGGVGVYIGSDIPCRLEVCWLVVAGVLLAHIVFMCNDISGDSVHVGTQPR